VVLTSNASREISDALRRRCLHLHLAYPAPAEERRIVAVRVPGIGADLCAKVVAFAGRVRAMDLAKSPSVSETIDWARALLIIGAKDLGADAVRTTLGALIKQADDAARVAADAEKLLT
jgi:MoxR-like ATPase